MKTKTVNQSLSLKLDRRTVQRLDNKNVKSGDFSSARCTTITTTIF